MSQSGQPQHFRMDGQGTQSGEKGYGKGFQAGGPTGPYPVGEVGPGSPQPASPTHQEQPSMPGSPGSARSFVHARSVDPDRTDLPHGN